MQRLTELESILSQIAAIGEDIAAKVSNMVINEGIESASRIHDISPEDVIYRIDRIAETVLLEGLAEIAPGVGGIILVAEGVGESGVTVFPESPDTGAAQWRLLVDPIDGTRGLMVDKRPAFFLAGIAPNRGCETRLSDICAAVMVEIPTTKMHLADTFSAIRGNGVRGVRRNRISGGRENFLPLPTQSGRLHGGFAQFSRFFSPGKELLARIEEELLASLYPDAAPGEIVAFEDQYISSGGQLYELLTGKDRFVADVRGTLYRKYADSLRAGHVCHPYDLAAHLIGSEAGLIVTGIGGEPLDGPFTTTHPMDWIGYANKEIFDEVSPVLNCLLKKHKLL